MWGKIGTMHLLHLKSGLTASFACFCVCSLVLTWHVWVVVDCLLSILKDYLRERMLSFSRPVFMCVCKCLCEPTSTPASLCKTDLFFISWHLFVFSLCFFSVYVTVLKYEKKKDDDGGGWVKWAWLSVPVAVVPWQHHRVRLIITQPRMGLLSLCNCILQMLKNGC